MVNITGTTNTDPNAARKGNNNDITSLAGLTTALSIVQGGTGGITAAAARAALAAAASGANEDITSLLGLTTPIAVRSHLAGCVLSTAGASATMSIAAGVAVNSTNTTAMPLSAIAKTTSAWAVGTAQGGLDTGTIANSTWYKFYVIQRVDTGVVDVIFTTAALATGPAMPTGYTLFRYIGSGLTDGSAQWVAFIQDGDLFNWVTSVLDVNATNPGTAAVTRTLTVPTGLTVLARFMVNTSSSAGIDSYIYVSPLNSTDEIPAGSTGIATSGAGQASSSNSEVMTVLTNTSGQVRSRLSGSDGNSIVKMRAIGWIDTRGRDS